MRPRVLLVDPDVRRGHAITRALSQRFECRHVTTVDEVMAVFPLGSWAAVVSSYELGAGNSGLEILQVAAEATPHTFRLFCADRPCPSLLHDAGRLARPHYAADSSAPDFVERLDQALWALLSPPSLEVPKDLPSIMKDVWTAHSPASREFLKSLREAAESCAPVYVYGEPGAGVTRAGIILRQWRQEWRQRGGAAPPGSTVPVAIVRVPSLRERPQDLPILAARVLLEHGQVARESLRRLSPLAVENLLEREWTGNVVELVGVLLRAYQRVGARTIIEVEDLPRDAQPVLRPSQTAKDDGQRGCVLRQLRAARNVSAAARFEGRSRANYIRLMRRLGIIRADVTADNVPHVPGERAEIA